MVRNCQDIGMILQKLMKRLLANQELLKLLYYTDKTPFEHETISDEIIQKEIFNKLIKITPAVLQAELKNSQSIVVIRINDASILDNDQFKQISVQIESFVPLDQWFIKNDNLRPFSIMGEIEKSLNNKSINGLGKINSAGFGMSVLTEEVCGYQQQFYITTYD